MSSDSRARFAAAVRADPVDLGLACLLVGAEVDPELDVAGALAALDELAATVRPLLPGGAPAAAAAEGLRVALGERAGFAGHDEDYGDLRASLLHEVLRRRRGLPILLSVVWLEVAQRAGVPAAGVGLPGHFVVRVGRGPDAVLVDPYSGGRALTLDEAAERSRTLAGVPLLPAHLEPAAPVDMLLRILTNVRALAARTSDLRTRLWAVELSLLLPRHPAALRREHGQLLAAQGDYPGGAAELASYAEAVGEADPASAAAARREARVALARLN